MTEQMPNPARFDFGAAIARLDLDSTHAARLRYPGLEWVWDELDELRAVADETWSDDDYREMQAERNEAAEERDAYRAACESALEALDLVTDPVDPVDEKTLRQGVDHVIGILSGAVE